MSIVGVRGDTGVITSRSWRGQHTRTSPTSPQPPPSTSITGSLILSLHYCWLLRLWSPQSCFYSLNVDTDKNIEYSNISGYFTQYAANVLKNLEIIIVKTRPSSTLDVKLFLGPLPPHPLISRLEQVIHFN